MIARVTEYRIVPVAVVDAPEDALPMADALLAAGLPVVEAGAQFGLAPGLNPRVVGAAAEAGWFFMPGVMTPSEVELALEFGARLLKFFPAEAAGGVATLRALAGPFAHTGVKFVPLGGVGPGNLAEYLALPGVAAVGGSWMIERSLIRDERFDEIERLARQAVELARG
jgi:2-dehydro-3-deoxyphosphogluconate aldolase/(4S)-4-hydroxy-2-oxoglutarate aldolase